jgi:hypothetical protein
VSELLKYFNTIYTFTQSNRAQSINILFEAYKHLARIIFAKNILYGLSGLVNSIGAYFKTGILHAPGIIAGWTKIGRLHR